MSLAVGTQIGPYEILLSIGEGGMGEVFKARDTRLDRVVALKISKSEFTERFEREAKAISSLNHPNICTLYDVGPNYLVMEYIEGAPLKGPLPLDDALKYAVQICDALDAAHKKGITHRDLKPANILVTKQGVKLLDFGLAKIDKPIAVEQETVTMALTSQGQILGTLLYMSPEQLQGKEADARSDIFSFGCVLYEMLTGRRAFEGSSAASTIAAILERPSPSIAGLAPEALDRVLNRCLEKDPDRRWQSASDLKWALENLRPTETGSKPERGFAAPRWIWLAWGAAAVFLLGFLFIAAAHFREPQPARPELMRLQIPLPEGAESLVAFTLSPDGRHLAYIVRSSSSAPRVWLRSLDSLEAHPLAGTEYVETVPLFWSYDSRFLVFAAGGGLKKIPIAGGLPEPVANLSEIGGSMNQDGVIILGTTPGANGGGGLIRISTSGTVTPLTVVDSRKEFAHHHPTFLPDGKHFLYLKVATAPENSGIYVGSLDTPAEQQSTKRLVATAFGPAHFVRSTDSVGGYLLFMRDGALLAQPFNDKTLEVSGDPVPTAGPIGFFVDRAFFSASVKGTLIYNPSSATDFQLSVLERRGSQVLPGQTVGAVRDFGLSGLALSPDGKRAAFVRRDLQRTENTNVWLFDLGRGDASPFTYHPGVERSPIWSPDGSSIVFSSSRNGAFDLYVKPADGSQEEELLLKSGENKTATSWSRDGHFLLYIQASGQTRSEIWVLPDPGVVVAERKPVPFLKTEFAETDAQFSPEATGAPRWVAYVSNESGHNEVYVRPFSPGSSGAPAAGGKWLVSRGGGIHPRWRSDGRELTYLGAGKIYTVEISPSRRFEAGAPKPLADLPAGAAVGDISADGSRILVAVPEKQNAAPPFNVVMNWQAGLKK
jgi:eukaryotic-like serine/threonine-protein kinase